MLYLFDPVLLTYKALLTSLKYESPLSYVKYTLAFCILLNLIIVYSPSYYLTLYEQTVDVATLLNVIRVTLSLACITLGPHTTGLGGHIEYFKNKFGMYDVQLND